MTREPSRTDYASPESDTNLRTRSPPCHRLVSKKLFPSLLAITMFVAFGLLFGRQVLFPAGEVYYRDAIFPQTGVQSLEWVERLAYSWNPSTLTGIPQGSQGLMTNLLVTGLYKILGSMELASKAYVLVALALPGIGMYFLVRYLTRSSYVAFAAGIFYQLNPFTFLSFALGHETLILAYAMLPLAFLFIHRYLKEGRVRFLAASVFVLVVGSTDVQVMVLEWALLGFYVLYRITADGIRSVLRRYLTRFLLTLGGFMVISLYWLFPTTSNPYFYNPFYPPLYQFNQLSISNSFFLESFKFPGFYGGVSEYPSDVITNVFGAGGSLLWYVLFALLVSFLFSSLVVRRSGVKVFLGGVTASCIFLAKGAVGPLGVIFQWAYFHVPYFFVFDFSYYIDALTAFGYVVLFGLSILALNRYSRAWHMKHQVLRKAWIGLIVVLLISASFVPIIAYSADASYQSNFQNVSWSQDFAGVNGFLGNATGGDVGTRSALWPAWVNLYPGMTRNAVDPIQGYSTFSTFYPQPPNDGSESNRLAWAAYLMAKSGNSGFANLLEIAGVKYVMLRNVPATSVDIPDLYVSPSDMTNNLQNIKAVLAYGTPDGLFEIYQLPWSAPLIYAGPSPIVVAGDLSILAGVFANYADMIQSSGAAAVFADQVNSSTLSELLKTSPIVFQKANPLDLSANLFNDTIEVDPVLFLARPSSNTSWWFSSYNLYSIGFDLSVLPSAYSSGGAPLVMHFTSGAGTYEVYMDAYSDPNSGMADIAVDGKVMTLTTTSNSTLIKWFNVGQVNLNQGSHTLTMTAHGFIAVSIILLVPTVEAQAEGSIRPPTVKEGVGSCAVKDYSEVSPTSYSFTLGSNSTSGQCFVVFNQTYSNGWVLNVGGKIYTPIPAWGFANGFLLPSSVVSNQTEATISSTQSSTYEPLYALSLITTIGLLVLLLLDVTKRLPTWKIGRQGP